MGKENFIIKILSFGYFSAFFRTKKLKRIKTPFMEKNTITKKKKKTCVLRIFDLIRYQNAEIHGNHPIWGNETTLPEACHISVFERIRH